MAKKKTAEICKKATMNFARRTYGFNYKKMLPIILLLVVAIAAFTKFGVLDQLDKKVQAQLVLSEKQAQLAAMQSKLVSYDELYEKYGKYSYGWMSESEVKTVGRMDVLALIERNVMPMAFINDFAINNNVLTLNLSGITLEQASTIVKVLEQDELVESASVYSASAADAEYAKIFMSVVLTNEKEGE